MKETGKCVCMCVCVCLCHLSLFLCLVIWICSQNPLTQCFMYCSRHFRGRLSNASYFIQCMWVPDNADKLPSKSPSHLIPSLSPSTNLFHFSLSSFCPQKLFSHFENCHLIFFFFSKFTIFCATFCDISPYGFSCSFIRSFFFKHLSRVYILSE